MILFFTVDKQIITRQDYESVVQDSQNYLYAQFDFSEEWTGQITAVFKGKDGEAFNVLVESGQCLVPWEVLTQTWFEVSVFCGNLITANVVRIYTIESGYEIGQESREPTPDVYNQIIEALDNINAYTVSYENEDLGVENVGDALDVLAEGGGGGGGGGTTPNIHMTASVDATTGTPDVEVTKTGTLTNPIFNLAFTGLKGETGATGPQGVQGETGATGPKGDTGEQGPKGDTGIQGPKGDTGATPIISASATVSNTTGTPSVNVSKSGTDEAPSFAFAFSNLKGETGSQGPQGIQGIQGPQGPQGPAGADGSVVTVTPILTSGTKIAEIDVDGNTTNLFAPSDGSADQGIVFGFFDGETKKFYADGRHTIEITPDPNIIYVSYEMATPVMYGYRQSQEKWIRLPVHNSVQTDYGLSLKESQLLNFPIKVLQYVGEQEYEGMIPGYFYKVEPAVVTEEMWESGLYINPRASQFSEYDSEKQWYSLTADTTRVSGKIYYYTKVTQLDVQPRGSTFAQFEVTTSGWTADTTSQSGSTLYKKAIALTSVSSTFGVVSIGSTGTLPTVAQQTAFDLVQYVTINSAVPCLYLYASDIPTDNFYIKVEGVA